MADIRVPTLGESVTEATVGKWFKQPGDAVAVDEPLVELETDKVTLDVPAPAAGVLSGINVKAGDTVAVGALLGQITDGAGAVSARAAPPAAKPPEGPKPASAPPSAAKVTDMPLPPSVRKMAAESGIDVSKVEGSGMRGQVTKGDMMAAIEHAAAQPTPVAAPATAVQMRAPSPADDAAREERVHMTRLRQTIARRLKDAQNTAAMLTTFNEVDMRAVMALRNQYKELFEKKHGVKLGFMGFFVRACIQALKEIPAVNAEIDGTDIVYKNYYHIGVAVGTERGLVVPVVRDADALSLAGIEKTISDFGRRAMVWRSRVICTRSSRAASSAGDGARICTAAVATGVGWAAARSIAASISPLVTWPCMPVPATLAASTPLSAAILRTDGGIGMEDAAGAGAAA